MIDLNKLHHAVHQVSGDMALKFCRAEPADLARWAAAPRVIAAEMEAMAQTVSGGTVDAEDEKGA